MPGRVDEVQLIRFAVLRGVLQRYALRLDRNSALALEIHRIEHLLRHFTIRKATAMLDKAVSQCRFAMVYMGND